MSFGIYYFFRQLSESAMFGATFNLVTRVGPTEFSGTLIDASLQIDSLASIVSATETSSKWRQRFIKNRQLNASVS